MADVRFVIRLPGRLVAGAFVLLLISCTTAQTPGRSISLSEDNLIRFESMSFRLPEAEGWRATDRTDAGGASVTVARQINSGHTVVASALPDFVAPVNRSRWETDMAGRTDRERLEVAFEELRHNLPVAERGAIREFQRLSKRKSAAPEGAECAEYRYQVIDEQVPGRQGERFLMVARSLLCIHPRLGRPVLLGYSERMPSREQLRPEFNTEADRFLSSLEFI